MNTHAIYKMAVRLFLGGALSVTTLSTAMAVTPSTSPLTAGSSAVLPNIMLMLDNSGSMSEASQGTTTFTATDITTTVAATVSVSSPNLITNTGLFTCTKKVNVYASGSGSGTSASPFIVNMRMSSPPSSGPKICTGTGTSTTSKPCSSSDYTVDNICFDNTKFYKIKQFASSSTTNSGITPFENGAIYSGQKLNWYFNINPVTLTTTPAPGSAQLQTFSSASNLTADTFSKKGSVSTRPNSVTGSVAGTVTTQRMMMVKNAARALIKDLTPAINPVTNVANTAKMRLALSTFEGDSDGEPDTNTGSFNNEGGALLSPMADLTPSAATTMLSYIGDTILKSGNTVEYSPALPAQQTLKPTNYTPLAETLADIGFFYSTGAVGNLTLPINNSSASTQSKTRAQIFNSGPVNGLSLRNGITGPDAPITSYCQKSYSIFVTDGLPTQDTNISSYLNNYLNSGDYLDDVAKAMYQMDLRPDQAGWPNGTITSTQAAVLNNVVTYAIYVGANDPDATALLDSVALNGGSKKSYAATSATDLSAIFKTVLTEIQSKMGSFSAVVANTSKLDANSAIFQASYDTADWTGNFVALKLNATTGIPDPTPVWQAGQLIPKCNGSTECSAGTHRNIFTYNTTNKGVKFNGASASAICALLSTNQKNSLNATGTGGVCDTVAGWRLDWLRGDISHEETNDNGYVTFPASTDPRLTTAAADRVFRNRVRYWLDSLATAVAATTTTAAIPAHTKGDVRQDAWLLGDIVNSDAAYVSDENYGYSKLPAADGGDKYAQFIKDKALRTKMVYIGANDGMLHGFNASVLNTDTNKGKETLAFIPESVFAGFKNLSRPDYSHQYFVDGSPRVGDAYFLPNNTTINPSPWHTVLVGTTGAGGKGVFALDVTTPDTFSASSVLWEISNNPDTPTPNPTHIAIGSSLPDKDDFIANMGYSLPQASIGKLHNGKWAAIVANGYDSTSKKAVLYVIDIKTGEIIRTLDTTPAGSGGDNGLSTPFTADVDADGLIDVIYAGDLLGNMWKFDVSANSEADWKVAYSTTTGAPAPLFTACNGAATCTSTSTRQAITNKPQVGRATDPAQKGNGIMVYFGTGKYFEDTDNDNKQIQSFYGVWDECPLVSSIASGSSHSCPTSVPKTNLQEQSILKELAPSGTITANVRLTSNTAVTYAPAPHTSTCITDKTCQQGWYIDFQNVNPTATDPKENGERIVSASLLRGGRIIFTTLIPQPVVTTGVDNCSPEANSSSWLMELNAISGSRLESTKPALDINNSGSVGLDDVVKGQLLNANDTAPASGIKVTGGSSKTPAVIGKDSATEIKCLGSSEGKTATCISETASQADNSTQGRLSWRQLP